MTHRQHKTKRKITYYHLWQYLEGDVCEKGVQFTNHGEVFLNPGQCRVVADWLYEAAFELERTRDDKRT